MAFFEKVGKCYFIYETGWISSITFKGFHEYRLCLENIVIDNILYIYTITDFENILRKLYHKCKLNFTLTSIDYLISEGNRLNIPNIPPNLDKLKESEKLKWEALNIDRFSCLYLEPIDNSSYTFGEPEIIIFKRELKEDSI